MHSFGSTSVLVAFCYFALVCRGTFAFQPFCHNNNKVSAMKRITSFAVRTRISSISSSPCSFTKISAAAATAPRRNVSFSSLKKANTMSSLTRLYESSSPPPSIENEVDPGVVDGTDLRIVKYPHPSLRADNDEITKEEIKDGSIGKIAKEMFLVMYAAEGVGLAAPQVGINKRLMVYNPSGEKAKWLDEIVMINPEITTYSEGSDVQGEGCLSFPDMNGDVKRSKWIKVEALNVKGKKIKRKFEGWEARIFQHEYDHLDGTVYIDRLSDEEREKVQPTLDKLIQNYKDENDDDDGAV